MKRRPILFFMVMIITLLSSSVGFGEISYAVPRLSDQLDQELEELPVMRTKQVGDEITVTVTGDLDYLVANWLGYNEEPEEVTLIDGIGHVHTDGHSYQLGASWNNALSFITVENFFLHENVSDDELLVYFDALTKIGDPRVAGLNPVLVFVKHLIPEYRIRRTIESYNASTDTILKDEAVLDRKPVSQVDEDELRLMKEALPDDTHTEEADGSYTNIWYAISESAYKVLKCAIGLNSNGAPNRAYLGMSGEYLLAWGRAGDIRTVTKTLSNTDCFDTEIVGATSYVVWSKESNDGPIYISDVVTYYPEGSEIAVINAEYSQRGVLTGYTVVCTDGHRISGIADLSGNVIEK